MVMPKLRLSDPQWELLASLPRRCVDNYKPALKLIELGLAEGEAKHGMRGLKPTAAGREALKAREAGRSAAWAHVEKYIDHSWGDVLDAIRHAARTHKLTKVETDELTRKASKALEVK